MTKYYTTAMTITNITVCNLISADNPGKARSLQVRPDLPKQTFGMCVAGFLDDECPSGCPINSIKTWEILQKACRNYTSELCIQSQNICTITKAHLEQWDHDEAVDIASVQRHQLLVWWVSCQISQPTLAVWQSLHPTQQYT